MYFFLFTKENFLLSCEGLSSADSTIYVHSAIAHSQTMTTIMEDIMNNKIIKALLIGTALTFSQGALAESREAGGGKDWHGMHDKSPEEREAMRKKWDGMSDEDKAKFRAERKAKWDALSKDEKVKLIDERHDSMKKRMDERWDKMSDDEKIKFAEERMKNKHHRKGGKDGAPPRPGGDDMPPPPPPEDM
jgi:hypothetical protein